MNYTNSECYLDLNILENHECVVPHATLTEIINVGQNAEDVILKWKRTFAHTYITVATKLLMWSVVANLKQMFILHTKG